jgi:hypothetical protein
LNTLRGSQALTTPPSPPTTTTTNVPCDAYLQMMTFDCKDELCKIKSVFPEAQLVLRVLVDDSYSVCKLGTKYGCPPAETASLLEYAKELGLSVIGVSFHVGSGCQNALAYASAVAIASQVFSEGEVCTIASPSSSRSPAPSVFPVREDSVWALLTFTQYPPSHPHQTQCISAFSSAGHGV